MPMRFALLLSLTVACGEAPEPSNSRDGGSAVDAGTPPPVDAGGVLDTGAQPRDTGATQSDAASVADSGAEPVDAGPATPDTGPAPVDAGPPPLEPNICSIYRSRMFAGCANGYCHGGAQAGGFRLNHGSAQELHDSLVGVETSARMYYVLEENVRMSYLINKLEGTQGDVAQGEGERMPPGGDYFDANQMQVLKRWIQTGASDGCPN